MWCNCYVVRIDIQTLLIGNRGPHRCLWVCVCASAMNLCWIFFFFFVLLLEMAIFNLWFLPGIFIEICPLGKWPPCITHSTKLSSFVDHVQKGRHAHFKMYIRKYAACPLTTYLFVGFCEKSCFQHCQYLLLLDSHIPTHTKKKHCIAPEGNTAQHILRCSEWPCGILCVKYCFDVCVCDGHFYQLSVFHTFPLSAFAFNHALLN